ncbi:Protein ASPARTIC PROTEASE IN GUARD CELL 2 [Dendrobium catenatum]|uniref:Protein ASPARTIC PROTEASE IN GUARD CELL 2 n=1 Tax=Dendrobium catenatum TaxID=906689 RepID=A0A2I0W6Y8_9ASPA|nr:Protein ASPARTIC PROTEASE IN GUARD CELL 2 [Dendrobium catenatum]
MAFLENPPTGQPEHTTTFLPSNSGVDIVVNLGFNDSYSLNNTTSSLPILNSSLNTNRYVNFDEVSCSVFNQENLVVNGREEVLKEGELPQLGTSPSKLNVVHQHGPCSSLKHQYKPSYVDLFRQDQARVEYIQRQAANTTVRLNLVGGSLSAELPTNIDYSLGVFNYIVNIGLGTPTKFFTLMIDTGSDLTWTQCIPCINCYNQKDPFYDPTQSSTFTTIKCFSNYCTQLPRFGCTPTLTCIYEQKYVSRAITKGSLIKDTLKFSDDNIQNIPFGCGHNNTGYFGHVDGLLGLGRGPNNVGYLELGSPALGVKYTPMLTNPKMPSFYFINLTAISVGGERLAISPTIFSGPGTLLDSGTPFTHLPPTAYSALRSVFREKMINYPMAPPLSQLDTCYDFTNFEQVVLPEILMIYDGEVTANLDFSGILLVAKKSQACLSFIANKDDSNLVVIGNMQQRRYSSFSRREKNEKVLCRHQRVKTEFGTTPRRVG